MKSQEINRLLSVWGNWCLNYIFGIGYPSCTVEYKISKGEIFGDGNKGGQKQGGDQIKFRENEEAERIHSVFKRLQKKFPKEMRAIYCIYALQWSTRKTSQEMRCSRYAVRGLLKRGKTLIEGAL